MRKAWLFAPPAHARTQNYVTRPPHTHTHTRAPPSLSTHATRASVPLPFSLGADTNLALYDVADPGSFPKFPQDDPKKVAQAIAESPALQPLP